MSARSSPVSHLPTAASERPLEARGGRAPRRRTAAGLDRRRVRRLLPRVGRRPPRADAARRDGTRDRARRRTRRTGAGLGANPRARLTAQRLAPCRARWRPDTGRPRERRPVRPRARRARRPVPRRVPRPVRRRRPRRPDPRAAADVPRLGGGGHRPAHRLPAPFAALQLVSGTLGERIGQARTIRWAFVAYAVTSFGAALAPSIVPFLTLRALQGASNAFTSPLLLAALAESTGQERLGRSMGTFAAVQTAGMVMAPLCGGLIGAIEPRLAFAVPGLVGLLLAVAPLPGGTRAVRQVPARLRDAFNRRSTAVAVAGFLAFLAINGVAFLVALRAAEEFGL